MQPSISPKRDSKEKKVYAALDSLRGVCAIAVVLFHIQTTGTLTNLPFIKNSWVFVDFFFVLSGFVISLSYKERISNGFPIREFMLLRLGRVYPLHLLVILALVLLEVGGILVGVGGTTLREPFTGGRTIGALLSNLLLLQIFGFHDGVTWNAPSWSIAAEVWTYLIAAIVIKVSKKQFFTYCVVIITISGVTIIATGDGGLDRTFSWCLPRCLFGFFLGVMACQVLPIINDRITNLGIARGSVLEFISVTMAVFSVTFMLEGRYQIVYPIIFSAIVLIFAAETGVITQFLKTKPLSWLGVISYSVYITHLFVLGRFMDATNIFSRFIGWDLVKLEEISGGSIKVLSGPGLTPDFLAFLALCFVLVAGSYVHTWIEKPTRTLSRNLAERIGHRRAKSAEAIAPTM